MATIKFEDFGGIAPGINPARLPDNAATTAHNCRLRSGRLEPLTNPEKDNRRINFEGGLSQIKDAKTIYLWHKADGEAEWIAWKGKVSVAPSNLAVDKNRRLFVTGETGYGSDENSPVMYFSQEYGYTKYPIIKTKMPKLLVSRTSTNEINKDEIRYTYFFQTWVDQYGYESPVSEPSDELEYNDGDQVLFGEVLISGELNNAQYRRIYKVITGTETEQIQFIAEQERVGFKFLSTYLSVKDEDAGEILERIEAPSEKLSDILWMPGSFYAGVDRKNGRTVCFSDVNLPYSWPLSYQYTVKDDIVGIASIGNTLAVLTNGCPWIISGTSPDAMSVASLASPYACVSKDSICTLGSTVYYASHSGICAITEGSTAVTIITNNWFGREAWEALRPETCKMVVHDQALFLWFTDIEGNTKGYIIDFESGSAVKSVTTHNEPAECLFEDIEGGSLCYIRRG